jgi:TRAP-type mannitol/chloroaromatic compound transport system permease large subunit
VPDAKMSEIILGVVPFVLAGFVILAILIAFPQIALWLPSQLE